MSYSYNEVNSLFEKGTMNVVKLPDRKGFKRWGVMLNNIPMRITSPKVKCQVPKINDDTFVVIFNSRDECSCEFADEMETLSQSIKDCFDKHYHCQTEEEILETIEDRSSEYPQTYRMYDRKFKFSSLFHVEEPESTKMAVYFNRDSQMFEIEPNMESINQEVNGTSVDFRFVFIPIIYSKDEKYYLRNEVNAIQIKNSKKIEVDPGTEEFLFDDNH